MSVQRRAFGNLKNSLNTPSSSLIDPKTSALRTKIRNASDSAEIVSIKNETDEKTPKATEELEKEHRKTKVERSKMHTKLKWNNDPDMRFSYLSTKGKSNFQ